MTQAKDKVCRCIGVLTLIVFLNACASLELKNGTWADEQKKAPQTQTDVTRPLATEAAINEEITSLSAQQLLKLALGKPQPEQTELVLYAARKYLDNDLNKTRELLQLSKQPNLPELINLRRKALEISLAVRSNQLDVAKSQLRALNTLKNSDPVFNLWLSEAHEQLLIADGNFIELLDNFSQGAQNASEQQQAQQYDKIWTLLEQQNLEQLREHRQQTSNRLNLGWIDLAIIARQRPTSLPQNWRRSLEFWQYTYPNHPAQPYQRELTSLIVTKLDETRPLPNTKIALLLPLTSPYQEIAQTIEAGFKAASLAENQFIEVYDTGENLDQLDSIYQQAAANADVIVGPLGKAATQHLSQSSAIIKPTILLGNITETAQQPISNSTFSFTLDPEHEAHTIAELAKQKGFTRASVMFPDTKRGKRVHQAFVNHWRQLGGVISTSIAYPSDLYDAGQPVNRLINSNSADMVFLAANAQQGRLLSQAISKRRPSMTVFATSSIYSGKADPTRDFVLNDVWFIDMPWMIDGFSETKLKKQQLTQERSNRASSLDRYYAFGVDAYALARRIFLFMEQPGAAIDGVTGQVQLRNHQFKIRRPLVQYSGGIPGPKH